MPVQKTRVGEKEKRCSQRAASLLPVSKTLAQRRAASWQNNVKDALEYREYIDKQAERAAQWEDALNFYVFMFTLSIFLIGYFVSMTVLGFLLAIPAYLSFYHALKLRDGLESLTPRGEGDRR